MFSLAKSASRAARVLPSARAFSSVVIPKKIGFIGLGNMGGFMAQNLSKHTDLVVFDISPTAIDSVVTAAAANGHSAVAASTPEEVASQADVVITMLPSSPHVKEVYTSGNGILASLPARASAGRAPALFIDSSTIAPAVAIEVARAVAAASTPAAQCTMIDAPTSGGVRGAKAGTLTFMLGGSDADCEAALPVLKLMGQNMFKCGGSGMGQAAKVCNNLVLGISMAGVAEALNLGQVLGLDAAVLSKILNTSTGRCWASEVNNPVPGVAENVPAARGYADGFGLDLMLKDLNLATESARTAGAVIPVGDHTTAMYKAASEAGFGKKDFGVIYQFIKEQNSKK